MIFIYSLSIILAHTVYILVDGLSLSHWGRSTPDLGVHIVHIRLEGVKISLQLTKYGTW